MPLMPKKKKNGSFHFQRRVSFENALESCSARGMATLATAMMMEEGEDREKFYAGVLEAIRSLAEARDGRKLYDRTATTRAKRRRRLVWMGKR